MTRYIVTKNFQDKYTGKYYSIGQVYETSDQSRATMLENGGYITPDNTEMAAAAKAEAKASEQSAQDIAKAHAQIAEQAEAKTIVNGKVVSLKQAQAAEAAASVKATKTGIQETHNNQTEAVQSGQVAKQNQYQASGQQQQQQQTIKQGNVQSGQQALDQELQSIQQNNTGRIDSSQAQQFGYEQGGSAPAASGSEASAAEIYNQQQTSQGQSQEQQQAAQAAAMRAEETNATEAAHEEAAMNAKAAAKARAKKE